MTTWFVSRHEGAIAWAKLQDLSIDKWIAHIHPEQIVSGDIVIGTLPVNIAETICSKGADFYFLSMEVRFEDRGKELSAEDLTNAKCQLVQYHVVRQR